MRPEPESTAGRGSENLRDQFTAQLAGACLRRDCDFGAWTVNLVGDIQVCVCNEFLPVPQQEVPALIVAAVAQVQQHVLGHGGEPIEIGDLFDERDCEIDLRLIQPSRDSQTLHAYCSPTSRISSSRTAIDASSRCWGTKR